MKLFNEQYDDNEWIPLNLLGAHLVVTKLWVEGVLVRTALQNATQITLCVPTD